MFNFADLIVIVLLLFAIFRGYKSGFIKTGFGVISFFVAILITFMFYKPVMSVIKEKTGFETWLSEYLYSMNLDEKYGDNESGEILARTESGEEYINNLPQMVTDIIGLEEIKENAKVTIIEKIVEFTVKLLSIIIVYILAKIILSIVVWVLDSIAKLPILKQFNELFGLILGAILGLIQIYTIFAVITLIGSLHSMTGITVIINNSLFAHIFYNNNLLLQILF